MDGQGGNPGRKEARRYQEAEPRLPTGLLGGLNVPTGEFHKPKGQALDNTLEHQGLQQMVGET